MIDEDSEKRKWITQKLLLQKKNHVLQSLQNHLIVLKN